MIINHVFYYFYDGYLRVASPQAFLSNNSAHNNEGARASVRGAAVIGSLTLRTLADCDDTLKSMLNSDTLALNRSVKNAKAVFFI